MVEGIGGFAMFEESSITSLYEIIVNHLWGTILTPSPPKNNYNQGASQGCLIKKFLTPTFRGSREQVASSREKGYIDYNKLNIEFMR